VHNGASKQIKKNMKTESAAPPEPAGFKPVAVTLTFESQAELDFFGKLLNFSPLYDIATDFGVTLDDSWRVLGMLGADTDGTYRLLDKLAAHPFIKGAVIGSGGA